MQAASQGAGEGGSADPLRSAPASAASQPLAQPAAAAAAPGPKQNGTALSSRRGQKQKWAAKPEAVVDPTASEGVGLCCNRWEHLGGAFGCRLFAGHTGPHALPDLPSRRRPPRDPAAAPQRKQASARGGAKTQGAAVAADAADAGAADEPAGGGGAAAAAEMIPLGGEGAGSAGAGSSKRRLSLHNAGASRNSSPSEIHSDVSDAATTPAGRPPLPNFSGAGKNDLPPPIDLGAGGAGVGGGASGGSPGATFAPPRKLHLFVWAQCDRCSKWRRLPPGHAPGEEAWWECSMNPKRALNRCEAAEEEMGEN
jgi:hypothetical protein